VIREWKEEGGVYRHVRFVDDCQNWWLVDAADTGFPLQDSWRLNVEKDDPQMIGP